MLATNTPIHEIAFWMKGYEEIRYLEPLLGRLKSVHVKGND
jgi:hypothetical protein